MKMLSLMLLISVSAVAQPQKSFMVMRIVGGQPDIDTNSVNYVLCAETQRDSVTRWGGYLFSGDSATLDRVAKRAILEIVRVTESGVKWAELDAKPTTKQATVLTTYLTAEKGELLKAATTNREVLLSVFKKFYPSFRIEANDVAQRVTVKQAETKPLEVKK